MPFARSWPARSCCRRAISRRSADAGPSGTSDLTARLATLTPQQVRVLQMLRQGLLNKQIAYDLGVGETTVKAHVSEILRKLKVSSRTQAVIEAAKIDFDAILSQSFDGRSELLMPPADAGCCRQPRRVTALETRCSIRARSSAGLTGFNSSSHSPARTLSAVSAEWSAVTTIAGSAGSAVAARRRSTAVSPQVPPSRW